MTAFDIDATGMKAELTHLNVISMNLANVKTTRTADGTPYRRKSVLYAATPVDTPFSTAMKTELDRELRGVKVQGVVSDNRPLKRVYDPAHPDSDKQGYVSYPDINVVEEMANMITAQRTFDANVASVNTIKGMYSTALELGK